MKTISIEDIVVENKYLRLNDDVETLMNSIENIGLIHPLVINKDNKLLAGGRRYTALSELGIQQVPVMVVDRSPLEQELISIEENIVRQKLSGVEFEAVLRRAKDIYEELYPEVAEDLNNPLEVDQLEALMQETGKKPFVMEVAEKIGSSPASVRTAIRRDIDSSSRVKKAREVGEINGSQATHISKLDKTTQNDILSVVVEQDLDSPGTRILVKETIEEGFATALSNLRNLNPSEKYFKDFGKTFRKLGKELQQFLDTDPKFDGQQKVKAMKEAALLRSALNELLGSEVDQEE
ncbi:MAG: ParB N-terminal domain-containing protein [Bacteriovoracaceae bacterium]|nr:ParB N-terminal domain-containing protein [Bacteriovoracaceae bacterium]